MVKVCSALLVASRKTRGKAVIHHEWRQSCTMDSGCGNHSCCFTAISVRGWAPGLGEWCAQPATEEQVST